MIKKIELHLQTTNQTSMLELNLKNILDKAGITEKQAAKELFPTHTHPEKALQRVASGVGRLDSQQILKLSALTGISVSNLFGGEVKISSKGATHTITTGDFRAELNFSDGVTKIYKHGTLKHETVLHNIAIPLSEYLANLQSIISFL